jgi:hypothetical protein
LQVNRPDEFIWPAVAISVELALTAVPQFLCPEAIAAERIFS